MVIDSVCQLIMFVIICHYLFVSMLVSIFCFFKQKTAYEVRISDWSSDVCSSDLAAAVLAHRCAPVGQPRSRAVRVGDGRERDAGLHGGAGVVLHAAHR